MGSAENSKAGELLEAQAHIWNHSFSFISSMSLKSAIELGIPDIIHLHGKPMTLRKLIDSLPINPAKASCIYRLIRILIHSGFIKAARIVENNKEEEGYLLTPSSKLLLKDEPMGVTPHLLSMLDPLVISPWHQLTEWFSNNDPSPCVTTHGASFWDMESQIPRLNNLFNEGMASDARLISRVLIENVGQVFEGISSLVDVGGGTGTMAKAITDAFPHLKCSVLDLPHVVEGLTKEGDNLVFVGGDMFQSIPPADAVLLKWILHDWSDEECITILKKCKEAIPSRVKGGKVMIIDMVVDEQNGKPEALETQLFFDMLMMVLFTGKERREKEWEQLFLEAGFTDYKVSPMFGLRSLIEVFY